MTSNVTQVSHIGAASVAEEISATTASPKSALDARVDSASQSAALPTLQQSKDLIASKIELLQAKLATNQAVDGQANMGIGGGALTALSAVALPPAAIVLAVGGVVWVVKSAIDKHFLDTERKELEQQRNDLVNDLLVQTAKEIFSNARPDLVGTNAENEYITNFTSICHTASGEELKQAIMNLTMNIR